MEPQDSDKPLSDIETLWPALEEARSGTAEEVAAAQRRIIERYGGAVSRYLRGLLHDEHAAEELTQEFALALVRGDFRGADPQRGRFRAYVKAVLVHLVSHYCERRKKEARLLPADSAALAAVAAPSTDAESAFDSDWRKEVLTHAWNALASTNRTLYTVLHFRAEHPEVRSPEMAQRLRHELGKDVTAENVRQILRRARDKYSELLVQEVAQSLASPTRERVEEELEELGLLEHCRDAFESYQPSQPDR